MSMGLGFIFKLLTLFCYVDLLLPLEKIFKEKKHFLLNAIKVNHVG